ncbi:ArsC family reductase [Alteromonas sp. a30]|uniref:ArsC family reductase n=1 Tax=Alteromonas sp. a30 TaxID=2730917 RepID=UPI00227EDD31|nr:ArsC family reductase [Alteromonas sp. a30]MCY7296362.1 ArsC family reductase [Alteromonas sp. a30]
MITLYGIKNCDTIKKTKKWLEAHDLPYEFHDYRVDGLDPQWLQKVIEANGWETVLNKRGTTYRQLSDEQKADIDAAKALTLLSEQPAMIKRPILQKDDATVIGFNESTLKEVFC